MIKGVLAIMAAGLVAMAASPAAAAPGDWVLEVTPIARPAEPAAVPLPVANPRDNPAHEGWAQQNPNERMVYNVVEPVLVPIAPDPATGDHAPAVILAPGGGFLTLMIDGEGYRVASRLAALGVRVFVLKYRTLPVGDNFPAFRQALIDVFQTGKGSGRIGADIPYAAADASAAVRMVRARAAEWHVDPARIGLVGFSAGAVTVLAQAQAAKGDDRADFLGMIYGPTQLTTVPANPPPLFAAISADDRFFKGQDLGLFHAWRQAGGSVEAHLYSGGGHGYASSPSGATSDAWFDQLVLWMKVSGFVPKR